MSRKRRRLTLVLVVLLLLGGASALALTALRDNVVFFLGPSEVAAGGIQPGQRFRLGGLVEAGSVRRDGDNRVAFRLTDGENAVPVAFTGLLPDLFREGQGVVTHGTFDAAGRFEADEVLAKHDENYMPPEVADALKKSGHWEEGAKTGAAEAAYVPDAEAGGEGAR